MKRCLAFLFVIAISLRAYAADFERGEVRCQGRWNHTGDQGDSKRDRRGRGSGRDRDLPGGDVFDRSAVCEAWRDTAGG